VPKDGLITALDIGTTKVCCFIAEASDTGGVRIVGIGHQASHGVKSGVIVDMDAIEQAVLAAVHSAEQMADETIRSVYANINAGQLHSSVSYLEQPLRGGAIDDADIQRLLHSCISPLPAAGRSLVHAIPVDYVVDGVNGIRDSRGLHGSNLGVKMHHVTANEGAVRNVRHCISRCLLDATELVASGYAAGLGCLVEDEIDLGATLIDMGGGTTSMAIFYDGALVHLDSIPVGGQHVTSDIARGLSTSLDTAERLKTLHGSCLAAHADDREMVTAPQIGLDERDRAIQVPRSFLVNIIAPRIEETFELVRARLEASGLDKLAGRRLVLTGGACQLPGVPEIARQILNKRIRVGRPRGVTGLADATAGPAFSACAGLLSFAVDDRGDSRGVAALRTGTGSSFFGRLGGWLRENF